MYTGALENHPALVGRLAAARPLYGNSADVLRAVRNPRLVAEAFDRAGLPRPAVAFDAGHLPPSDTWLCKPRRSAGGAHIEVWDGRCLVPRSCYLQELIAGTPHSAVYLAAGGRAIVLGITRQLVGLEWTGAAGFRYCGSIGPARLRGTAIEAFASIGDVLASSFGLVGLFGVDAIVNADGVWPVEVNPRYTASVEVLERALKVSAIHLHVAACRNGKLPEPRRAIGGRACGKAVLFATSPVVAGDWDSAPHEVRRHPQLADVPHPGTLIQPGWPIVSLIADGKNSREVLEQLRCAAEAFFESLVLQQNAASVEKVSRPRGRQGCHQKKTAADDSGSSAAASQVR